MEYINWSSKSTEINFRSLTINIVLPAYDQEKNGVLFNLIMEVHPSDSLIIDTNGNVARSLKKSFSRAIAVMSNLNSNWKILKKFKFNLTSTENQYRVMDARSAGVPICIALLNLVRALNGKKPVQHFTGTGILRIDGTFEKSHLEEKKKQAISQFKENHFINSEAYNNVFDLAIYMNH